jgi:hypothetical protein
MSKVERKSMKLELSDMDTQHRTAVIAHAVYDNIDRAGDISRKGMFNKSWKEKKAEDIVFDIDHDPTQQPGLVKKVWETEKKAFSQVWFGSHTLGNDTMLMMDEGIMKGASFEFVTEKKSFIEVKGRKVRELKEVQHLATTVTLALPPVNPLAGVESVTKAGFITGIPESELKALSEDEFNLLKRLDNIDQQALQTMIDISNRIDKSSDLYEWVLWQISRRADAMGSVRGQLKYNSGELKALKDHVKLMEKFCRNTTASDECIQSVEAEIKAAREILSAHDTAHTQLITEPGASVSKEFSNALYLLTLKQFS